MSSNTDRAARPAIFRYEEMLRRAYEDRHFYEMEQAGRGIGSGYRGALHPAGDVTRQYLNEYWRRRVEPALQPRGVRPLEGGAAQGPEAEGGQQAPKRPRMELNVRQHTAVALPAPGLAVGSGRRWGYGLMRQEAAEGRAQGAGAGAGGFKEEEEPPAPAPPPPREQQEVADRGAAAVEAAALAVAVELPSEREVAEYDASWQSLALAMQRGANHVLGEMDSYELTRLADHARNIEDLVDRAKEVAVEREMKVAAAEKAEAERARNVAVERTVAAQAELEKVKKEHQDQIRALKEAQEAALAQQKGEHDAALAEEQHKSVCKICLNRLRDSVLLPCMHFDYCLQCLTAHRLQQNTCPTCRGPIHGMLKCNLGLP